MSFRGRLALFFVLIVVLPMVVVAVLAREVTDDSATGKADAGLAAGLQTALAVSDDAADAAAARARQVARDPALGAALERADEAAVRRAAERLAREQSLSYLRVESAEGEELATVGSADTVASATIGLTSRDGSAVGSIEVSTTSPRALVREVERLTGQPAALAGEEGVVASTLEAETAPEVPLPGESGELDAGDETLRSAAVELPQSPGLRLALFTPRDDGGFLGSSPLVAAALLAFFAVALMLAILLVRVLQGQIATMLDGARRIGDGDFSHRVPVSGNDEMAGLATEFNRMSDRLAGQMDELRRQRIEIESSVNRLGEAFASGLDRENLLKVVIETAVGTCGASFGRIALADGEMIGTAGEPGEQIRLAVVGAEGSAAGGLAAGQCGDAHALAAPLTRVAAGSEVLGVMSIARVGEPFGESERDVFRYLIGQTSASIVNIAMHAEVSEQAVTDELTGLANKRAFGEHMQREALRAERFGHPLSLVILDLDDFKQVNDTHGHLQGDEVLRAVGRILESESREIDEAARYGGEEFVMALPETASAGANELAERIRARIEAEAVPMVHGDGELHVTASVGTATLPDAASTSQELIAAADAALYEAKRAGKNRVVWAQEGAAA